MKTIKETLILVFIAAPILVIAFIVAIIEHIISKCRIK